MGYNFTTPTQTAAAVQARYALPTGIGSQANAGVGTGTGPYSALAALTPYHDANVQYQAVRGGDFGNPVAGTAKQLGDLAAQERQATAQRNIALRDSMLGGFDQRIANSRTLADQNNSLYGDISRIALETRDRNMGRIDQYGDSLRQELEQNRQRQLAAGTRSAISRGLANSTIRDALDRGTEYDYGRQRINLEDSLLKDRIGTDTALSQNYQNTLQGRVGQNNQNIGVENQLTGERLSFLNSITDQGPSFADVGNYYLQAAASVQPAERPTGTIAGFAPSNSGISGYDDMLRRAAERQNAAYANQQNLYQQYQNSLGWITI